jgi:hypothetical protein
VNVAVFTGSDGLQHRLELDGGTINIFPCDHNGMEWNRGCLRHGWDEDVLGDKIAGF